MAGISDNEELESETEYVSEADNMDAHDRDASPGYNSNYWVMIWKFN
jgi:hypothetical protein